MYINPPVQINAAEIRPRRLWFIVAAVIITLGATPGIFFTAMAIANFSSSLPKADPIIPPDERVRISLSPDVRSGIYSTEPYSGYSKPCQVTAPNGTVVKLTRPDYSYNFTRGNRTWYLLYRIHPQQNADHHVSCSRSSLYETDSPQFTIAKVPDVGKVVRQVVIGIGSFVLGIAAGTTIIIVVAVRRTRHRRQLRAAAATPRFDTT